MDVVGATGVPGSLGQKRPRGQAGHMRLCGGAGLLLNDTSGCKGKGEGALSLRTLHDP